MKKKRAHGGEHLVSNNKTYEEEDYVYVIDSMTIVQNVNV